jgi:ankyrin
LRDALLSFGLEENKIQEKEYTMCYRVRDSGHRRKGSVPRKGFPIAGCFKAVRTINWAAILIALAMISGCGQSDKEKFNELSELVRSRNTSGLLTQLREDPTLLRIGGYRGQTVLHTAAYYNLPEAVAGIIDLGADVNVKDGTGETALHWAARHDGTEAAQVLLNHGARLDLFAAIRLGMLDDVNRFIDADPSLAKSKHPNGMGTLHWSLAIEGWEGVTASEGMRRENARAALPKVREVLLKNGADVNMKDANGYTPLHYAAGNWRGEALAWLLDNGADPNAKTTYGSTALHRAMPPSGVFMAEGCAWLVKMLLDHKADPNVSDKSGETPLHVAAEKGWTEVVELLIARGANPNAKTMSGKTALDKAKGWHRDDTADFLRSHSAGAQ